MTLIFTSIRKNPYGTYEHILEKQQDVVNTLSFCLFCLFGFRLYVPVNIFSVMSGRSHRFLGITSTFWEVNVSCSMIQHGDLSEDRTPDLSLRRLGHGASQRMKQTRLCKILQLFKAVEMIISRLQIIIFFVFLLKT